jgi:hypothetical protein
MLFALSVSPLFEIVREDTARKRIRPAMGAASARGALGSGAETPALEAELAT